MLLSLGGFISNSNGAAGRLRAQILRHAALAAAGRFTLPPLSRPACNVPVAFLITDSEEMLRGPSSHGDDARGGGLLVRFPSV